MGPFSIKVNFLYIMFICISIMSPDDQALFQTVIVRGKIYKFKIILYFFKTKRWPRNTYLHSKYQPNSPEVLEYQLLANPITTKPMFNFKKSIFPPPLKSSQIISNCSTAHSSEIRGLCSTKCSSKTLQNLLYFMYDKAHVVFFPFSFRATLLFPL